jgi:hypothetical protein
VADRYRSADFHINWLFSTAQEKWAKLPQLVNEMHEIRIWFGKIWLAAAK